MKLTRKLNLFIYCFHIVIWYSDVIKKKKPITAVKFCMRSYSNEHCNFCQEGIYKAPSRITPDSALTRRCSATGGELKIKEGNSSACLLTCLQQRPAEMTSTVECLCDVDCRLELEEKWTLLDEREVTEEKQKRENRSLWWVLSSVIDLNHRYTPIDTSFVCCCSLSYGEFTVE